MKLKPIAELLAAAFAPAPGDIPDASWSIRMPPDLDQTGGDTHRDECHRPGNATEIRLTQALASNAHLQCEVQRLEDESAALLLTLGETRRERDRQIASLQARLGETERRLQQAERRACSANGASGQQTAIAELTQRLAAAEQVARHAERQNAELSDRNARLTTALTAERERGATLSRAFDECLALADHLDAAADPAAAEASALPHLAGRNILCVGGRTVLVDRYRRLAQGKGARFVHHDGGQEESPHRLDALIAGADIVLCQAGYISHPTYWRLKEACKRRGLPCVFLKSAGVSSFARGLETATEAGRQRQPAVAVPVAA